MGKVTATATTPTPTITHFSAQSVSQQKSTLNPVLIYTTPADIPDYLFV